MFWADRIAGDIEKRFGLPAQAGKPNKPLIIRDEKTLSGRVHIGSMRGVAIHGLIAEVLKERSIENSFLYELNDFDPFDSVPGYLDQEKFKEHLGKPLFAVPSPEPGFANFAEYYGAEFIEAHKKGGFAPSYYRTYADLYKAGKMDALIKIALERAVDIRKILKDISGSQKDDSWLPVSVVCEKCGKIMTTSAHGFDGNTVAYTCERNPDGALSCGHEGRVSPFLGNAKLFWKVDWAAKWVAVGVEVEGAGKDHSTKGGSRDVANHISKEIFGYEPPLDIPYEFFLVGGQKMSSSKGRGSSAKEIADLMPTKIFRLALLGKDINQHINFDPEGDTLPVLYDQYDKLAEGYKTEQKDDYARLFELVHPPMARSNLAIKTFLPRFSQVAFVVQMQHLDLQKEFPDADKAELEERAEYAKRWIEQYAPEKYVFKLQQTLPEEAKALLPKQKEALGEILAFIEVKEGYTGEELHHELHEIKSRISIEPGNLFKAIYISFLGRESGPQAGWFLSGLDKDFVIKRLKEASQ